MAAMKNALLAALLLCPALSFAGSDGISSFRALPAPPKTMQAAAAAVKVKKAPNARLLAPAYDDAARGLKKGSMDTGVAAGQEQMNDAGMDVDVSRLQSDPQYAAQFRAKMQAMSPAEQMAMAQRMQAGARGRALQSARDQQKGRANAMTGLAVGGRDNQNTTVEIHKLFEDALKASDERHAAVDAEVNAQLKSCPTDKEGYALPPCAQPLGQKGIAKHKEVEAKCLADENAVYAKAYALAKARVDAIAPMQQAAREGGRKSDLAAIDGTVIGFSGQLVGFAKAIAVRSGFWGQGVKARWDTEQLQYVIPFNASASQGLGWPPDVAEEK